MNDLRFCLDARLECWVTAGEIRQHKDYASAIAIGHTRKRLFALQQIAKSIAEERIVRANAIEAFRLIAYPVISDIDINRIDWQELAKPDAHV